MVMKKAPGGDSPLRQGAGKSFWTLRSRIDDDGGLQYVFSKIVRAFRVFSSRRIYRRKGDVRGWTKAHPIAWRNLGVARAMAWRGRPLAPPPPPSLLWTSSRVRKNRNFGFCFVQSENISCVTFLKHKNSKN
jgi:hypothetical protein